MNEIKLGRINIENAYILLKYIENTYTLDELSHSDFRTVIMSSDVVEIHDIDEFRNLETRLAERIKLYNTTYIALQLMITQAKNDSGISELDKQAIELSKILSAMIDRRQVIQGVIHKVQQELSNRVSHYTRYELSGGFLESEMGYMLQGIDDDISDVQLEIERINDERKKLEVSYIIDCDELDDEFLLSLPLATTKLFIQDEVSV